MDEEYSMSEDYYLHNPDIFSSTEGSSLEFLYNLSSTESPDSALPPSNPWCGPSLKSVGEAYGEAHGALSLIICLLGCIANLLNLVVLTRREMVNPTNAVLTGLALADLLNEVEYMPFVLFTRVLGPLPKTYGWALFILCHSNFSQVCHTISIWLTVTLAVWRYIMVAMPMRNKTLCTMERAKLAVGIAYVSSLIVCVPVYLTFSIKPTFPVVPTSAPVADNFTLSATDLATPSSNASNATSNPIYIVHYSELAKSNDRILIQANFWIYSVVIKIIPCIVLTVVSLRLINSLMEAKRRKEKLLAKNKRPNGGSGGGSDDSGSDRTTKMLLAVLLLFLITEFPQGVLGLLSGLLDESFFKSCYIPLGDLMDFTALLNSAINFILYCSMSKKFRETFVQTFHLKEYFHMSSTGAVRAEATSVVANGNGNTQYTAV